MEILRSPIQHALLESVMLVSLENPLGDAESSGEEVVTVRVAALQLLLTAYKMRGEALLPYARMAKLLNSTPGNDAVVFSPFQSSPTVICDGDLANALEMLPGE